MTIVSTDEMKQCPRCHEEIKAIAQKCRYCHEYLSEELRRQNRPQASSMDRLLGPVDTPGSAIAAGYLGLFAAIPLPFGIAAIICGRVALKTIKQDPHLAGRGRAIFGIVSGTIFTLIYGFMILVLIWESVRLG